MLKYALKINYEGGYIKKNRYCSKFKWNVCQGKEWFDKNYYYIKFLCNTVTEYSITQKNDTYNLHMRVKINNLF